MKAAIFSILFLATSAAAQDEASARFICREIKSPLNKNVQRCENAEVYCYITGHGGLWCWPKGINVFSTPPSRTQGTGAPIILQAPPGSVEPIFEPSGPRK